MPLTLRVFKQEHVSAREDPSFTIGYLNLDVAIEQHYVLAFEGNTPIKVVPCVVLPEVGLPNGHTLERQPTLPASSKLTSRSSK
jgi:hypothetical protein